MSDAPRLRTLPMIVYEQTEAQWAVDTRTFSSNVVGVPIDGSDAGKHKLFDGTHTYAQLSFVESGGGGGGQLTADELAAVNGAASPSASNVFATANDLVLKEPAFIPIIHINSGSLRGSLRQTADQNGRDAYLGTIDADVWSLAWDGSTKWRILNGDGDGYEVAQDVVTPDLITNSWSVLGAAVAPLPTLSPYGPTGQEAVEELAARVPSVKQYVAVITQAGTDAPEATILFNSYPSPPVPSRIQAGNCTLTLSGAFPASKTIIQITPRESPGEAQFVYEAVATGNTVSIGLIAAIDTTSYDGWALNVTITTYE